MSKSISITYEVEDRDALILRCQNIGCFYKARHLVIASTTSKLLCDGHYFNSLDAHSKTDLPIDTNDQFHLTFQKYQDEPTKP